MLKMKNFHVFLLLVIPYLTSYAVEKLVWADEFNGIHRSIIQSGVLRKMLTVVGIMNSRFTAGIKKTFGLKVAT